MRNSLKWAAAAASVLVLSLVSVQQTGAAWRDDAPISDKTITSGSLDISVGTGDTGFKKYDFDVLEGPNMMPGTFVQKPLVVFNTGKLGMKYKLTGVSQASPQGPVSMNMSISQVANEAACPATGNLPGTSVVPDGPMSSAAFVLRPVLKDGKEVLCVRATMNPGNPQGRTTRATLNFEAEVFR